MDDRQAAQPDIDCFSEIFESNDVYSSMVLVATGERLVEADEVGAWRDAVSRGARTFLNIRVTYNLVYLS